jgi:hypothetical protein
MQDNVCCSCSVVLLIGTLPTVHFVPQGKSSPTHRNQLAYHSSAYASIRFLNAWARCSLMAVKLYFSFAHS